MLVVMCFANNNNNNNKNSFLKLDCFILQTSQYTPEWKKGFMGLFKS